jgi:hypothetical protein
MKYLADWKEIQVIDWLNAFIHASGTGHDSGLSDPGSPLFFDMTDGSRHIYPDGITRSFWSMYPTGTLGRW